MKNNKKGNKLFLSAMLGKAMIIAVLAFGLVLTGCPTEDDGGGVPSELRGTWVSKAYATIEVEITSDKLKYTTVEYDISVSGKTITLKTAGVEVGSFDYEIDSADELKLSNGKGSLGTFTSYSPFKKK